MTPLLINRDAPAFGGGWALNQANALFRPSAVTKNEWTSTMLGVTGSKGGPGRSKGLGSRATLCVRGGKGIVSSRWIASRLAARAAFDVAAGAPVGRAKVKTATKAAMTPILMLSLRRERDFITARYPHQLENAPERVRCSGLHRGNLLGRSLAILAGGGPDSQSQSWDSALQPAWRVSRKPLGREVKTAADARVHRMDVGPIRKGGVGVTKPLLHLLDVAPVVASALCRPGHGLGSPS